MKLCESCTEFARSQCDTLIKWKCPINIISLEAEQQRGMHIMRDLNIEREKYQQIRQLSLIYGEE